MHFARAAARAIKKPTRNKVLASAPLKPMAAVDAIRRFDGPANGMRFSPNDVPKIIKSSIGVAVPYYPVFPWSKLVRAVLIRKKHRMPQIIRSLYGLNWANACCFFVIACKELL